MGNKDEEKKSGSDIVEFLGLQVAVNKVVNPHLQKVISGSGETGYKFWIQYHNHNNLWIRYNDYHDYRCNVD